MDCYIIHYIIGSTIFMLLLVQRKKAIREESKDHKKYFSYMIFPMLIQVKLLVDKVGIAIGLEITKLQK